MYELFLTPPAQRELRRFPQQDLLRIGKRLRLLQEDPRPPGCRKLTGSVSDYRIRVGHLRIIYTVDDGARQVRIFRIRPRSDAYR